MVVSALTVEEMIAGWPYPDLPLVTAEPTYEDIATMQKHLNANFSAFPPTQEAAAMATWAS
jgi:hypothetical protein